jgi:hypothetical protein
VSIEPTAGSLLRGIVADLQRLVRQEIALARQETLEELGKVKGALLTTSIAVSVIVVGGALLVLAAAGGLADLLDWPVWAGQALVGALFALIGGVLASVASRRRQQIHPIPEKTVHTVKENAAWLKQRIIAR